MSSALPGGELTATEVSEDVVALLREGDFVHSVPEVAVFQHAAGIFSSLPSVFEAFHMCVKPVDHICS